MTTVLNFSNYQSLVYNGARIIYGQRVAVLRADASWNGGFTADGRSICNILEEYDQVELIG
jgi:hypothetical protein